MITANENPEIIAYFNLFKRTLLPFPVFLSLTHTFLWLIVVAQSIAELNTRLKSCLEINHP